MRMQPADLLQPTFSGSFVVLRCGFQSLRCRLAAAVADDYPSPTLTKKEKNVVNFVLLHQDFSPFPSDSLSLTGLKTVQSNT